MAANLAKLHKLAILGEKKKKAQYLLLKMVLKLVLAMPAKN